MAWMEWPWHFFQRISFFFTMTESIGNASYNPSIFKKYISKEFFFFLKTLVVLHIIWRIVWLWYKFFLNRIKSFPSSFKISQVSFFCILLHYSLQAYMRAQLFRCFCELPHSGQKVPGWKFILEYMVFVGDLSFRLSPQRTEWEPVFVCLHL